MWVRAPWSQWRGPCRTCTDFPVLHHRRECSRRSRSRAAGRRGPCPGFSPTGAGSALPAPCGRRPTARPCGSGGGAGQVSACSCLGARHPSSLPDRRAGHRRRRPGSFPIPGTRSWRRADEVVAPTAEQQVAAGPAIEPVVAGAPAHHPGRRGCGAPNPMSLEMLGAGTRHHAEGGAEIAGARCCPRSLYPEPEIAVAPLDRSTAGVTNRPATT